MNCPNCGAEISKHAKFCSNCGQKLSDVADATDVADAADVEKTDALAESTEPAPKPHPTTPPQPPRLSHQQKLLNQLTPQLIKTQLSWQSIQPMTKTLLLQKPRS